MSITEFTEFRLIPPYTYDRPDLATQLLRFSAQQSAASSFPIVFYRDAMVPTTMYMLTGWYTVTAHERWLCSSTFRRLKSGLASYIEILAPRHFNLDFDAVPKGPRAECSIMCLLHQTLPGDELDDDDRPSRSDAFPCVTSLIDAEDTATVSWTGAGADLTPGVNAVYRLIAYASGAPECLYRKHGVNQGVVLFQRIEMFGAMAASRSVQ